MSRIRIFAKIMIGFSDLLQIIVGISDLWQKVVGFSDPGKLTFFFLEKYAFYDLQIGFGFAEKIHRIFGFRIKNPSEFRLGSPYPAPPPR